MSSVYRKSLFCHGCAARLLLLSLSCLMSACSSESLNIAVAPATFESTASRQLSPFSRAAINAWLRFDSWRGERSGYVALFAIDGHPVYATATGWADIASHTPMTPATRMRVSSMTKPITAVAALMLIEENRLGLDDAVADYLPAFAGPEVATREYRNPGDGFATLAAQPLLIRHLLTFTAGMGPGDGPDTDLKRLWEQQGPRSLTDGTLRERVNSIARLPLFEQPGTRWRYGYAADVLAGVVEVAAKQDFEDFLQQRIFTPLGMDATHFRFLDPAPAELATVYTHNAQGELVASAPDSDVNFAEGGSGLVTTAEDYLRFALMLWNEGEYRGMRLLQRSTVERMRQLQVPAGVLLEQGIDGLGWGLGMAVVADAEASALGDRNGDYWWSGHFGTTFFVSPTTGLVGVVLSQHEPGPHSEIPIALFGVQSLAFMGL